MIHIFVNAKKYFKTSSCFAWPPNWLSWPRSLGSWSIYKRILSSCFIVIAWIMSWPANRFAKSASVSDSTSDVTSQCRSTLIKVIQEGRATRGGHTLEGEARGQMCRIDLEQVLSCALCQSRYEQILTRAPTKWTWNIISVFKIEWIYIVLFKKKLRVEFLKTKPANAQAVRHQSLCANTSVSFFWLASFLGQHVTPDALKENRLCLVLWSSVVTLLRVEGETAVTCFRLFFFI